MTEIEAADIIENIFKAHWSTWKFPLNETKFWVQRLIAFDYAKAVVAVEQLYAGQEKQRKPAPAVVLAVLHRNAYIKAASDANDMVPLYTIIRPDGRRRFFPFSGLKNTPIEAIEEGALAVCRACNRKEEGHYINFHVGSKAE